MRLLLLFLLVGAPVLVCAQSAPQLVVLHELVGTSIDSAEKVKYHLFPNWPDQHFSHAEFYRNTDSTMFIVATMRDNSADTMACSKDEFGRDNFLVRYYAGLIPKEKKNSVAWIGALTSALSSGLFTFFAQRRHQ